MFLAKIKDIEISLLELPHQFRQHFKYHPSQEYLQRINLLLSIPILHWHLLLGIKSILPSMLKMGKIHILGPTSIYQNKLLPHPMALFQAPSTKKDITHSALPAPMAQAQPQIHISQSTSNPKDSPKVISYQFSLQFNRSTQQKCTHSIWSQTSWITTTSCH